MYVTFYVTLETTQQQPHLLKHGKVYMLRGMIAILRSGVFRLRTRINNSWCLYLLFFLAVGPLGFQHTLMAHQTNVFCKSSHNNLQWVVIIRKKATREALGNPSCIIHGYQDLHTPCSFLDYVHVRASFQMHSLQLSCGFQLWGLEFWHGRAYCLRDWEPCAA